MARKNQENQYCQYALMMMMMMIKNAVFSNLKINLIRWELMSHKETNRTNHPSFAIIMAVTFWHEITLNISPHIYQEMSCPPFFFFVDASNIPYNPEGHALVSIRVWLPSHNKIWPGDDSGKSIANKTPHWSAIGRYCLRDGYLGSRLLVFLFKIFFFFCCLPCLKIGIKLAMNNLDREDLTRK